MARARTPKPSIVDEYFVVREFGWTQSQIAECDEWWLNDVWTAHQIRLGLERDTPPDPGGSDGGTIPLSEAFPDAVVEES